MSMRLIVSLSLALWVFMGTAALAQDNAPVLDKNGKPLRRGVEYYIRPAITDVGGRFTLINRNGSCPLYVGLENTDSPPGLPVTFTPFAKDDKVVKVGRDFKVAFAAATTCAQSTLWKLDQKDTKTGRRLIVAGQAGGIGLANYFRIVANPTSSGYFIQWCPTDVCPTCKFICGTGSTLRENGKILWALDSGMIPVQFLKK